MSFNAGELVATIRLDGVDKFGQQLDQAKGRFSAVGDIAKSAMQAAAATTTVATAAAAAYATSLFKTGVAYNTLQQTSRAALKTLTGGVEQANAQMDKLDDFARNSPFSKSVFITAQQQLLGFGVEAKRVLPTLSAIQDTVASFGGSNDQIAAIADILARIQSQGRLSGDALERLGYYGVDAAKIIGDEMGVTAGEIKDMASKPGGIPVEQIWDPLVNGMTAKFGGAAADVKKTFAGTVDRIRAASRDIGSALAEPFVSSQGGGMFVSWGNQVADVMRAVQSQTTPVVNLLVQRALPAFAGITTSLDKANVVVKAWDSARLESFLNQMGQYAPLVAGFAGAWATVGLKALPVIGGLTKGLAPLPIALAAVALASPEVRAAMGEVLDSLKPLIPVASNLAKVVASGLNAVLPVLATGITVVAGVAKPLVEILASIPTPVLAAVAGFALMQSGIIPLKSALGAAQTGIQAVSEHMAASAAVSDAMGGSVSTLGVAARSAGGLVTGLGNSLKAAFISNPIGIILLGISVAAAGLTAAFAASAEKTAAVNAKVTELRGTMDAATGAFTGATREMVAQNLAADGTVDKLRDAGISVTGYTNAMQGLEGGSKTARDGMLGAALAALKGSDAQKTAQATADSLGISYETLVESALYYKDSDQLVQDSIKATGNQMFGYALKVDEAEEAIQRAVPTVVDLSRMLNDQEAALKQAKDEQEAYREAVRKAAEAMTDAERSNKRLNDALTIARDVSKDATERVNALRQALDELKGGSLSAADATAKMNETNLNLAETLAQVDDAGNTLWTSVLDGAGSLDTTSRAGLNLHEQMKRTSEGMLQASQSAYDLAITAGESVPNATNAAVAAGDLWIANLRETLTTAGLTEEQINGLIGTYLSTPTTVATLITDNGTISATDQSILALSEKIAATPDKTVTISEPFSPEITKKLEALGIKVTNLPDGTVEVNASGIPGIEDALNNLVRTRTAHIATSWSGGQVKDSHMGNLFTGGQAFSNGGFPMQAFAGGGFPSGVYAGVTGGIHRFAEKELGVPWELYLSGKASAKARNQQLLEQVAPRLGMQVVPIGQDRQTASAAVQSFTSETTNRRGGDVNVTFVNPVAVDPLRSAQDAADLIGVASNV